MWQTHRRTDEATSRNRPSWGSLKLELRVMRCNNDTDDVDGRTHHLNNGWQLANKNETVNTLAMVLTLTVAAVTAARRMMTVVSVVSAPADLLLHRHHDLPPTTRCRRCFQLTATPPDTLWRLLAPIRTADIYTSTSSLQAHRRLMLLNPFRRLQNATRKTVGHPSYGPPTAMVL